MKKVFLVKINNNFVIAKRSISGDIFTIKLALTCSQNQHIKTTCKSNANLKIAVSTLLLFS